MVRLRAAVALYGAGIVLAAMPARALDPHAALTQYGFQSWQTDSGLPQNTVHAIVQGRDGFLWIATEGGLVRFDGVDFAVLTHANTPGLPSDLIDGLMEDRDGTLWISTSGGLGRMRSGRIEAIGAPTQVWRTFEDARGMVWALTASGLFRVAGDGLTRVALDADLTENSTMAQGADGTLWLGTQEGLLRAGTGGVFRAVGAAGEVPALAVDGQGAAWAGMRSGLETCTANGCHAVKLPDAGGVDALAADGAGRIWAGTETGLWQAQGAEVHGASGVKGPVSFLFCDRQGMVWAGTAHGLARVGADGATEVLAGGDVYLAAIEDREGDLWLGTEAGGLQVLRDRKFSTLTAANGLTDEYVLALAQAPNGHVGVGTKGGGLNVFRDGKFYPLTTAQGLSSNVVLTVAAAANGDVWVGTPDGLDYLHEGNVARIFTTADGLADDFVRSLYVDRRGTLWIGTRHGLSQYANGKFTTWTALDGLGSDLVGAMTEDAQGILWIGTLGGLTEFRDGRFRNFTTKDGLSSNVVTALHPDRDGTLWIGTNDGGLNWMHAGKIVALRVPGLPERVLGILEDASGSLWLSSNTGVYRVWGDGLKEIAEGTMDLSTVPRFGVALVMRFGVADGMRISEGSSGGHPAALRLADGELWFATLKGIARVDPEHMPVNRVPPQVALERVSVDDVPQTGIARLTVAPGHSHYEFDYAGLSFVAPQKVEYRYQLQGFDRGWVDAGTRRAAYYTNLPHGRYTFRVMARNNDGVWSDAAATAELTVEPHFYQTLWFEALAALALIGLGWATWRRRLLGVERQYEAVLGERTRIAREIHDTLAQGFVAVSVQLELIAQLMQSQAAAAKEQLNEQLNRARAMVRSSLEDARSSIWELRSQTAEREDLAARLLKLAEETIARGGSRARAQMQVSGAYRPLDGAVEREVLRIAREAVTNAVRHGDPKNVLLRLEFDEGQFGMEIRDDGRGFDGAPADGATGHFGLTGMRERAAAAGGSLTVESRVGEGTRARLEVPLAKEAAGRAKV